MDPNENNGGASSVGAPAPGIKPADKNVSIKFVIPRFNLNGKIYVSKELEAAAAKNDAEALKVIEELIEIKSSVIQIVNPE